MVMNKISLSPEIYYFFENEIYKEQEYLSANIKIYSVCGIKDFFVNQNDFLKVNSRLKLNQKLLKDSRIEYGDFQTPDSLAKLVVERIINNYNPPTVLLEPTSGQGNFILPSLEQIPSLKKIYCIEIYKPYIWISKFRILDYFLKNKREIIPHIEFIHQNIFDLNLSEIVKLNKDDFLLILGNPPWITNSQLGILNSDNLPQKSNFKNHSGFDAITGKGNFDIAEYICLMLLKAFSNYAGSFAFLLKNIVIKNLINDQFSNKFRIGNIHQQNIDAKKEFNVSTDASLFYCELNKEPEFLCSRSSIYDNQTSKSVFGYVGNKFVSEINSYNNLKAIDGTSSFIWRQGVKHDCSKVMELEKVNSHYKNQNNENIYLEEDLVYGLLKSSDLAQEIINETRKYTIITQKKIGEDTTYIKTKYPKTYSYLEQNKKYFEARKSKIYNEKPPYSIFGIGSYSFAKYKVGISGFYKQTKFSLILPIKNKPIMLDDTCYFIGFDSPDKALITLLTLNHPYTQSFINSIIFFDAKRVITKDILMRIDIAEAIKNIPIEYFLEYKVSNYNNYFDKINPITIQDYINSLNNSVNETTQIQLFS